MWVSEASTTTPRFISRPRNDADMVRMLLAHGADANEITRIDDYETALEVAEVDGRAEVVEVLRPRTSRLDWNRRRGVAMSLCCGECSVPVTLSTRSTGTA